MKTTEKPIQTNRPELCAEDRCFLPDDEIRRILQRTGLPVFLFDEKGLRACAEFLLHVPAFDKLYVNAALCPFPEILRMLCKDGIDVVCCNPGELQTAVSCGISGEQIVYAGVCAKPELADILYSLDAEMLLSSAVLFPEKLTKRVSILCRLPSRSAFPAHGSSRKPRAGLNAEEATVAASMAIRRGARDLCLAAEPDSNATSTQKAAYLIRLAEQIKNECGAEIKRIRVGDLRGPEYHRFKPPADLSAEFEDAAGILRDAPGDYRMECGVSRNLIEPNAIFAAACLGAFEREALTILLDASFRQLSIPQLDRYRHISVLGKNTVTGRRATDVLGVDPLAKDWFASSRLLPAVEAGDCLILHDVGCCTTAAAECFLIKTDGSLQRLSRDLDCFSAFPDAL